MVAALFFCGASLTRYEGWALIPVVAVVLLCTHGFRSAAMFSAIAAVPPLYWLAHNWWYYGNAAGILQRPVLGKDDL